MAELIGQILLNQYRVETFAALTPLGELYRAADTWHNNKHLALTNLPKPLSDDTEALKALDAGSSQLREVSHPNLVPYRGLVQTPNLAFLLEDWVDGPTLREVLERAPLSTGESLIYIKSLCSGL